MEEKLQFLILGRRRSWDSLNTGIDVFVRNPITMGVGRRRRGKLDVCLLSDLNRKSELKREGNQQILIPNISSI
jgi:hypothetical protein